jgi:hypothetical protein
MAEFIAAERQKSRPKPEKSFNLQFSGAPKKPDVLNFLPAELSQLKAKA